jgi:hypothetical protein
MDCYKAKNRTTDPFRVSLKYIHKNATPEIKYSVITETGEQLLYKVICSDLGCCFC